MLTQSRSSPSSRVPWFVCVLPDPVAFAAAHSARCVFNSSLVLNFQPQASQRKWLVACFSPVGMLLLPHFTGTCLAGHGGYARRHNPGMQIQFGDRMHGRCNACDLEQPTPRGSAPAHILAFVLKPDLFAFADAARCNYCEGSALLARQSRCITRIDR